MMKRMGYVVLGLIVLVGILLGGLLVTPAPFQTPPGATAVDASRLRKVAIPDGLPAPVERWLRADYPDGLPVADSIVMTGRGEMRMAGLRIPMRHRVEIRPGRGFLRRMELTWFGITVAKGRDTFVEGVGKMETPVGPASGPEIDQGANVVNWLEALTLPGTLVEDDRVRWEPVDEDTARLVYPFGDDEDSVLITFGSQTGRPAIIGAKRYRNAGDAEKADWTAHMWDRAMLEGGVAANRFVDAEWAMDGRPWATFEYESAWANAPVPEYDAAAASPSAE